MCCLHFINILGDSWVWICAKSSRTASAEALCKKADAGCFPHPMHMALLRCRSKLQLSCYVETSYSNKVIFSLYDRGIDKENIQSDSPDSVTMLRFLVYSWFINFNCKIYLFTLCILQCANHAVRNNLGFHAKNEHGQLKFNKYGTKIA